MVGLLKRVAGTEERLEMIYISNEGTISQRIIKVLKLDDESIKAYCYTKRQFRTFNLDNILSVGPVRKRQMEGA